MAMNGKDNLEEVKVDEIFVISAEYNLESLLSMDNKADELKEVVIGFDNAKRYFHKLRSTNSFDVIKIYKAVISKDGVVTKGKRIKRFFNNIPQKKETEPRCD